MRIAYLVEDTSPSGGHRVVIAHGDLLSERGHDAVLVTKGERLGWRSTRAIWRHVDRFDEVEGEQFDFVVGTFWTTLDAAFRLGGSERGVHLCQGYEGAFTAYRQIRPEIEAAYRLPLPKITVSPHLEELCRGFNEDVECVGQVVDPEFYQERTHRGAGRPRVLLVGPAQIDFKGIDVGYRAVRHARELGAAFDLVRASQWPPDHDEPVELASEFHVGLDTAGIARLIGGADIFLGPSRQAEGFGLPAAEAMASGVATLLTRIPSFLSWNDGGDHALFVDEDDWLRMSEGLVRLLSDAPFRQQLSERGRVVAEQFRGDRLASRLEAYFERRQTSMR